MNWSLLISVVSVCVTLLGFFGIDKIFKEKQDKRLQARNEAEALKKQEGNRRLSDQMQSIIKTELVPISQKLENMTQTQKSLQEGYIFTTRQEILRTYHDAVEKGYVTVQERSNFHDMVNKYFDLGGNSYVHVILAKFDEIEVHDEY